MFKVRKFPKIKYSLPVMALTIIMSISTKLWIKTISVCYVIKQELLQTFRKYTVWPMTWH